MGVESYITGHNTFRKIITGKKKLSPISTPIRSAGSVSVLILTLLGKSGIVRPEVMDPFEIVS